MQLSTNSQLRTQAREALRGNWAIAVVATLLYVVIILFFTMPMSISYQNFIESLTGNSVSLWSAPFFAGSLWRGITSVSFLLYVFVGLPVVYGYITIFLKFSRDSQPLSISDLFVGFRNYSRTVLTILLMSLYTFLWMLLLYIPGLIKSYSYAMTPYLLADHPEMSGNELIEKSMRMMKGNKMKLFLLDLSFIGWILLTFVTCGLAMLWVGPYTMAARAAFYNELKEVAGE